MKNSPVAIDPRTEVYSSMVLETITLTTKIMAVLSGSFGAYLIGQALDLTQFQGLSGTALASAAVCALWFALKVSYQARLKDKDEVIEKLETRIETMEEELKEERDRLRGD